MPDLNIIHFYGFFRNAVNLKTMAAESKVISTKMTAPWHETTLPIFLSNYKLGDIFNAGRVGLFYQCLLNKIFCLSVEKCSGGKVYRYDGCKCDRREIANVYDR